jgi:hypothetical protein
VVLVRYVHVAGAGIGIARVIEVAAAGVEGAMLQQLKIIAMRMVAVKEGLDLRTP